MNWFQIWVRHSDPINQVAIMKRCDPVIQKFGSVPCAPDETPVVDADGTIEVRSFNLIGFKMTKDYLQDQGFKIIREQAND